MLKKLNLLISLAAFLVTYVSNSQEAWSCFFNYDTKSGQFKPLEENLKNQFNDWLSRYGFQKEYSYWVSNSDYAGVTAIGNKSATGKKFRYLLIPQGFVDSLSKNTIQENLLFQFFHAYGHHLNKHRFVDSIQSVQNELQADKFAGYHLRRLEIIRDTTGLTSILPTLKRKKEKFENQSRIEAIKNGWEFYERERLHYFEYTEFMLFLKNSIKEDSLYKFAEEEKLVNPKKSALAFSNAYRYSNAKNLKALHSAFNLYTQLKDFDLALFHGIEILKQGSGFLSEEEQQAFFLEMSKIYFQRNNCSKAIDFSDLASLMNQEDSNLLKHQTELIRQCSNFKNNIAILQKRVAVEGATTELYFKLSQLFFENQNRQKALQYLKRILYLDPNHVNARLLLSKLYIVEWEEMTNILKNQETFLNLFDFKRILKTKNELFKKAENTLKDGLELNKKNKVFRQELKRIRKEEKNVIIYWPNRTYYTIQ